METLRMNQLYQELAVKLNEMIPDQWTTIYLYGEVLSDSRTAYFYYNRASDGKLIYSHDIPSVYKVDKRKYLQLLRELFLKVNELQDEYKANNENVWKNLTFVLNSNGQFNMRFGYDDFRQSEYDLSDQHMIWMYEVLGIEPEDERDIQKLKAYKDKNVKLFWK